jgi:hypothetical protein
LHDSDWAANELLKTICDGAEAVAGLAEFERNNSTSILIISVGDAFSLCEEFYQTLRSKLHDSRRYNAAASRKAFSTEEPDSAGTKRSRKRERQEHDEPTFVVGLPIAVCEMYDKFTAIKGPFAHTCQKQNQLKDI